MDTVLCRSVKAAFASYNTFLEYSCYILLFIFNNFISTDPFPDRIKKKRKYWNSLQNKKILIFFILVQFM